MPDTAHLALVLSFLSALAASGAYFIQLRWLSLERAVLVITSACWSQAEEVLCLTVLNVGHRSASNVEATLNRLIPGRFIEGIAAGAEWVASIPATELPSEVLLAYDDPQSGRYGDARALRAQGDDVAVGWRRKVRPLDTGEFHVLPPTEA